MVEVTNDVVNVRVVSDIVVVDVVQPHFPGHRAVINGFVQLSRMQKSLSGMPLHIFGSCVVIVTEEVAEDVDIDV